MGLPVSAFHWQINELIEMALWFCSKLRFKWNNLSDLNPEDMENSRQIDIKYTYATSSPWSTNEPKFEMQYVYYKTRS